MSWFRKTRTAEWQMAAGRRWTLDLSPELRAVAWSSGDEEGDPCKFKGGIESRATGTLDPRFGILPGGTVDDAKSEALMSYRVGLRV